MIKPEELKELCQTKKRLLTKWEQEFMRDLLKNLGRGEYVTSKQLDIVHRIRSKLTETGGGDCRNCSDGWVLVCDHETKDTLAMRCRCSGGEEFVMSQYRQSGRKDIAETIPELYKQVRSNRERYELWGMPRLGQKTEEPRQDIGQGEKNAAEGLLDPLATNS